MKNTALILIAAALVSSSLWAQPAASLGSAPEKAAPKVKKEKTIEHIRTEDGGARIDETRVGGETQSITVQPTVGDVPAYEVKPADNTPAAGPNGSGVGGKRLWNVHKF